MHGPHRLAQSFVLETPQVYDPGLPTAVQYSHFAGEASTSQCTQIGACFSHGGPMVDLGVLANAMGVHIKIDAVKRNI